MRLTTVLGLLVSAGGALAGLDLASKNNIVLYWGQNSAQKETSQDRLATYCQNPDVNVILLSFLIRFVSVGGEPELNFANQGHADKGPAKYQYFPGTQLFKCPELEADIQECQLKKGKTILLSFGGASYSEGGIPSADLARSTADKIWAMFGPPQDGYKEAGYKFLRPFGYASVDGFDFDVEAANQNLGVFGNRLKQNMDQYTNTAPVGAGRGRKFYLTAAPQCPFPEKYNADVLANVPLDAVFVQFFNNECGVTSFDPEKDPQPRYNFNQWDQWARTTAPNTNVKVLMGVLANWGAGGGYKDPDSLDPVIAHSKKFDRFGGTMIWDASQAWANPEFIGSVKSSMRTLNVRSSLE